MVKNSQYTSKAANKRVMGGIPPGSTLTSEMMKENPTLRPPCREFAFITCIDQTIRDNIEEVIELDEEGEETLVIDEKEDNHPRIVT